MLPVLLSSLLMIIASFSSSTMAMDPLFTARFDVSSSDNYGAFIDGLRKKLGGPGHFSHNRPVLPPAQPGPPSRWFHVVLTTPAGELTLATRADNLYLEGFRSRDGTWWELTRGVIPGRYLLDVALGPQQMTTAVHMLAARTGADLADGVAQDKARHALAALLLMVNEATRLTTVSDLVVDLMHPRAEMKSDAITAEMNAQVHGWADLSAALLRADARPPKKFTPFKDMGVETVEQAAKTLGILLFVKV
ncbi:hypothetical protein ACP4OV_022266 [Aristida adscensionis]